MAKSLTSLKSFCLENFVINTQFRTILAAKIKHTLSVCLCKKHRQFFRGELSEENPGIPLHIVENFGIIHGVVTCP